MLCVSTYVMRSYIAVMVYRHIILNWTLKQYMKVKWGSREIRKKMHFWKNGIDIQKGYETSFTRYKNMQQVWISKGKTRQYILRREKRTFFFSLQTLFRQLRCYCVTNVLVCLKELMLFHSCLVRLSRLLKEFLILHKELWDNCMKVVKRDVKWKKKCTVDCRKRD